MLFQVVPIDLDLECEQSSASAGPAAAEVPAAADVLKCFSELRVWRILEVCLYYTFRPGVAIH